MSRFSLQVKDDLAGVRASGRCCQLAELSAIIRTDGSLHISYPSDRNLELSCASAAVARKVIKLFQKLFGLKAVVRTVRRSRLSGAVEYLVTLAYQRGFDQALNELGILDESLGVRQDVLKRLVGKKCCAACYLRGLFLGAGYISGQGKPYHFEISTGNPAVAEEAQKLFARFGVRAGLLPRRRNYAVYLKGREEISKALAVIGAFNAHLEWESQGIVKSMKTYANRLVNCDTANLDRTVQAAAAQVEAIEALAAAGGLNSLSPALSGVARARLRYPQVSTEELGRLCDPPLSKSAVYHRLRRIVRLAEGIRVP